MAFVKRIVILFSGEGTNMEHIIRSLHQKTIDNITVDVVAVITNNPQAPGIKRAKALHIATYIIPHTEYTRREEFDAALVKKILSFHVDLVVLAGFMRLLTPIFTNSIRAINIHPSLLPLYKGAHAIEESFYGKEKKGGVSIHVVTGELDGGEIIMQEEVAIDEHDTLELFEAKIHAKEYELYPQAIVKTLTRA